MPTWMRLCVVLLVCAVLALLLAHVGTRDASFSINADTEIFAVEPDCGQRLVWDLPDGAVGMPAESGANPPTVRDISVALRGGARARVQLDGAGRWIIELGRSASIDCGRADDTITVTAAGATRIVKSDALWLYRSAEPVSTSVSPVLLLSGRVVIGDEIGFGRGGGSVAVPVLQRAHIDVRTPDAITAQRRQIHDESLDPGGMIDTHGCLDAPAPPRPDDVHCVRRSQSASVGFFRAGNVGDAKTLQVQVAVTGRHVGVRPHGGSERRVLVTWWSRVITSSLVQMFVAAVVLISALTQLWGALAREAAPTRREGQDESA